MRRALRSLDGRSRGRPTGCCRAAAPGRALGLRARSRRDDPGRIHPAAALSRHASTPELEQRIARYLRATQGAHGGWPLFHGGAFDISASVKAYFALKAAGDPVDAPHMARARAAILAARRRPALQRLHPHPAGAVRRGAVAGGAGDAGRDHAAAALVPVSHRQDLVLVAHRARAAAGADGAAAAGAQPARRHDRRAVCSSRRTACTDWITPPTRSLMSAAPLRGSTASVRRRRADLSGGYRGDRAIDKAVAFRHRAAQRRGRARRDFPGDGQCR